MKLMCDREQLLSAFQTAAAVAPSRSPKPVLQNVKIEAGKEATVLLATDLEVGIRIKVLGLEVEAPGSALLPIARVGAILRESSSDSKLLIETNQQGTVIKGERSEFKLPAENPDEFPSVAAFSDAKYHEVPARLFRELVRRTLFATDNESSRYALGGVLVEMAEKRIIAVGTDGRRLAKMEGPATSVGGHSNADMMTIIPARAMQLMERAFTDADEQVQIAARANDVLVRTPRVTIYSRLVEGRFPKWRDVFPQRQDVQKIELPVGPFYGAVRQAAIVTSEESRGVDFTFAEGMCVLAARAAEVGQSHVELPVSYNGPSVSITLDPRYLSDFLKVLDPEKTFTLELKDAVSAAVCHTDDGYGYVIMPLARDR
jgi:DNA polymerase III subunit beta